MTKLSINKKELKQKFDNSRLSNKTTPSKWRKVRNFFGGISIAGGILMMAPFDISDSLMTWITFITSATGVISGRAHLTKNKN